MIFLDTNIFLRFLTEPADDAAERMRWITYDLFQQVSTGELEVTTSEVVLHETCFILISKSQYGQSATDVAEKIRHLLNLSGFKLDPGEKRIFLRALDILAENPKLEFADSVIAARVERLDIPLATFDERLAKLPTITRWVPETTSQSG